MARETSHFTPLWMRAAARHQDENSTTECLVMVLRLVAQFDKKLFSEFIAFIFEVPLKKAREFGKGASVQTQEPCGSEEGPDSILDIKFTSRRFRGIIEVKVGSRPTKEQLAKYLKHHPLGASSKLVLLTVKTLDDPPKGVVQLQWRSLGNWFDRRHVSIDNKVIRHLVVEFVRFLRERGMMPTRVDGSLVAGVQALENLLGMIANALVELDLPVRTKEAKGTDQGAHYMGYAIDVEPIKRACWVGVYFAEPNVLRFKTEKRRMTIDKAKADKCDGTVFGDEWVVDMPLDGRFFRSSLDEQAEIIQKFIKGSLGTARGLRLLG